ncbi:hypothetical protein LEMLEM_LOCUS35 [Lemmus lemmus]
MRRSGS